MVLSVTAARDFLFPGLYLESNAELQQKASFSFVFRFPANKNEYLFFIVVVDAVTAL